MGNSIGKDAKNIQTITNSPIFQEYKQRFEDLDPSRKLYIDEEKKELIIKTDCSIIIQDFNWNSPDIETDVFEYTDELYGLYLKQCNTAIHFIKNTMKNPEDWDSWVNTNFFPDSDGDLLFKRMSMDFWNREPKPHFIWGYMLAEASRDGILTRDIDSTELLELVPGLSEIKEITDMEGRSLVYMANIWNNWWYVGISKECLDRIEAML